jgi:hypothetical protein
MKRYITFILAGFFVFFHFSLQGQSMTDLRLNELLIVNTDDYQDNFGEHNGWFEYLIPDTAPWTLVVVT